MNTLIARVAFLLWVACWTVLSPAQSGDTPKPTYKELVNRLRSGDLSVDYGQLRVSYSAEEGGYPDLSEDERPMFEAFGKKDWQKALHAATKVLDKIYVEMDAHFVAFVACRELGQTEKSEFHKAVLQGLMKSLLAAGDGRSSETAIRVIDVHEEYAFLRLNGLQFVQQSLVRRDGHAYDVVKVTSKDNATFDLYFNIDIPMKRLSDVFKPES